MSATEPVGDPKAWAKKIIARHEWGQRINRFTLSCARQALGLPEPAPKYRMCLPKAATVASPTSPSAQPQAMTPAEAYYASEQAARSASA